MSFRHSMTAFTQGIRATTPVQWRSYDGLVGVYWKAEGQPAAKGYYLSPDPRIVVFFNDVSPHIRMTNREGEEARHWRPMTRAIYVPAGVPLWSNFTSAHSFSHLDLHLSRDRVLGFLAPSVGRQAALDALRSPVEVQDTSPIESLAKLLVDEITRPTRHAVYAEHLVGGIVSGLLDIPQDAAGHAQGGLTQMQMKRLSARLRTARFHRLTVPEMAEAVGLSESWFAHAFKKATGKAPLQWQQECRIEMVKQALREEHVTIADVAGQFGFSDQAHFTRVFRQVTGTTPAAWLREIRAR